MPVLLSLSPLSLETGTRPTKKEHTNLRCKRVSVPQNTKAGKTLTYALHSTVQDFVYPYWVWITRIKLLYAPLQYPNSNPDIHLPE